VNRYRQNRAFLFLLMLVPGIWLSVCFQQSASAQAVEAAPSSRQPLATNKSQAQPVSSRDSLEDGTGSVIIGRIKYRGPVPDPVQVPVLRDQEACGSVVTVAPLAIDPATFGLRDAVVHVWGIGEPLKGEVKKVSVVKNQKCVFSPRVEAAMVGDDAEVSNGDPVMHNTHITIVNRTMMNVVVVPEGTPVRKPFKATGTYDVRCNVHKFMQAYRVVFNDPYFDQTNEQGQFRISGVPPGRHQLSIWHETLGLMMKEVIVPAKGTVTIDLEFKSADRKTSRD
jgi:plastocyanin